MKECAYCGRENDDAAVGCRECGTTEFIGDKTLRCPDNARRGWAVYGVGWAIFLLSALAGLSSKSSSSSSNGALWPFWLLLGILFMMSLVYCVGCFVSEKWRSKAQRRYFSPYLLGSTGWLILFLAFGLLGP
jgi:hypothetical protein